MTERTPINGGVQYADHDLGTLIQGTYATHQFEHECSNWQVLVPSGYEDEVYSSFGAASDAAHKALGHTWEVSQDGSHHDWVEAQCTRCGAWADEWEQPCR